jgi:hypothetical protein
MPKRLAKSGVLALFKRRFYIGGGYPWVSQVDLDQITGKPAGKASSR